MCRRGLGSDFQELCGAVWEGKMLQALIWRRRGGSVNRRARTSRERVTGEAE
uniref:Uncharacterized protein n=1 Tax=Rhizophora mucronata TaxID=61149 RepID=A0A2P2IWW2_RHIMU